MSTPSSPRHDPYAVLRVRDFRLLLTGRFITSFGGEMLTFAIGWELWLRTHNPLALGMVGTHSTRLKVDEVSLGTRAVDYLTF